MKQLLYEQPREKLQSQGARYLTFTELLQIIIGSGSIHVSAARLAKRVDKLITANNYSFVSLSTINGLGEAKVCQILAAIEIGRRMTKSIDLFHASNQTSQEYVESVRKRLQSVLVIFHDGSSNEIDRKFYSMKGNWVQSTVRNIFSDAVLCAARSVEVYVGKKGDEVIPDAFDISFLGRIKEMAVLLQISINEVLVVTKLNSKNWSSEL